jgi:hypothetical protein
MSRAFQGGHMQTEHAHRERTSGGRQWRRDTVEANSGASPQDRTLSLSLSLSRSRPLATLVTPTTSTPVQDNISLIPSRLCSILHQPIWAGARSDKFTSRLTVLSGPKRWQVPLKKNTSDLLISDIYRWQIACGTEKSTRKEGNT